jgi:hypothetical protein
MIKRYEKFNFKESLFDPSLFEAREFVYRDYAKLNDKWMIHAHEGIKKPDLFSVIKKVTKKFNSYNTESSKFTADELTKYYIKDKMDSFHKSGVKDTDLGRKYYIEGSGLDTLPAIYQKEIEHFIKYGN